MSAPSTGGRHIPILSTYVTTEVTGAKPFAQAMLFQGDEWQQSTPFAPLHMGSMGRR